MQKVTCYALVYEMDNPALIPEDYSIVNLLKKLIIIIILLFQDYKFLFIYSMCFLTGISGLKETT